MAKGPASSYSSTARMHKNAPINSFPCWYGKYELLQRLGSGGMAEVFLARLPGPEGFERTVVIKRILPSLAHEPRMEDAFVAEATLAAQVQHKNVVQVFELQRLDNGELFMSMEYVDGTDLARLLRVSVKRKLRIPPWFSVKCVSEVLGGLAHAHELKDKHGRSRNLVHRDVTPSNIFISKQGVVKLADFGVAKDETRASQTLRGELKGKLPYMSPEQVRRLPIDRRTDIFAAGVVLWEFLAQRRLFGGAKKPEIEVMNLICLAPRIPPSVYRKDVHPDLDRCVLRALQIDPEARYQDAVGFQKQLIDVLDKLHPDIQDADVRDIVQVLLGEKPAPPTLALEASAAVTDGDYTRTDSSENSTELTSMPAGMIPVFTESEKPGRGLSYRGGFPFWARSGSDAIGPQNYWDVLDWLKRLPPTGPLPEISVDGEDWASLERFARLTGQEGIFLRRRMALDRSNRIESSFLAALAALHRARESGTLVVDFPSGSAEIRFSQGKIASVISSHPQLQTPDILVRESIMTQAEVPAFIHRALCEERSLEDVAMSDGWNDPEQVRSRTIRQRLATLLSELVDLNFRRGEPVGSGALAMSPLPLLPVIVHEAISARSLKAMLSGRMRSELVPTERLVLELDALELGEEEESAVRQLLRAERIDAWLERQPEYETLYLYLAYLLLEIGLVKERTS